MKPILTTAALVFASPALAETDFGALIADQGLRATEAQLAALPDPTPSERFALGGVRFLGGIENALQLRYRVGIPAQAGMMVDVPILRLPVAENPTPEPFAPDMIAALFADVITDMEGAAAVLQTIGADDAVGVRISTDQIWFDINANDRRDPGEGLNDVLGDQWAGPLAGFTVNFDTADSAWLLAYSHLLSGISELVLAFDPTTAIAEVRAARDAIDRLNANSTAPMFMDFYDISDWLDYAAIVIGALERQPDADRTRAAQAHFLATIQNNRRFWALVAQETDNDAEWIPNKHQESATGLPFPTDTGARWMAVLTEAEAVLTGNALIPFWRFGEGIGLDLNRLMQDPPEVNVVRMIHGMDLLPYAAEGRVMSGESFFLFSEMMGGNAGLYMVILN